MSKYDIKKNFTKFQSYYTLYPKDIGVSRPLMQRMKDWNLVRTQGDKGLLPSFLLTNLLLSNHYIQYKFKKNVAPCFR